MIASKLLKEIHFIHHRVLNASQNIYSIVTLSKCLRNLEGARHSLYLLPSVSV